MKEPTSKTTARAGLLILAAALIFGLVPRVGAQDEPAPVQDTAATPEAAEATQPEAAPPAVVPAEPEPPSIEETRAKLEQWVETRRIISQEKKDLELSKQLLQDRIELLQDQISALEQRTADIRKKIANTDEQFNELEAENKRLTEASKTQHAIADQMEADVRKMLKRLPEPLVDELRQLVQQLPNNDEEKTKLGLSKRFGFMIGILNGVNKFHREISQKSEIRPVDDGKPMEVTVMYLGVSKAYYVNKTGDVAGIGTPGEDGWVWTPANDQAAKIKQAIAILKNEQVASFVELPLATQQ